MSRRLPGFGASGPAVAVSRKALLLVALWPALCTAAGLRLDAQPPDAGLAAMAPLPEAVQDWRSAELLAHCADRAPDGPSRWSLSAAISAVVCRHAGVQRSGGLALQAQGADRSAQARWQPALSLSTGVDAQKGAGSATSAVVQLDWVLLDFGQRSAAARSAARGLAASLDEQRSEVLGAVAQAVQLYTASQAAQGRLDAVSASLRQAESSRQLAEARREAGAASMAERHRADTTVAQARAEHARALEQWLVARGALAVAMGLPPQTALDLDEAAMADAADGAAPDIEALLAEARERHPQIQAARARVAEARARWDAVGAERWGSVGLSLQSGRTRSTTDLQMRSITKGSLAWSIPLFDREDIAGRRDDALGQWQVREAGLTEAQAQIDALVWEQSRLLQGEQIALRESERARDSADAAWRVTAERYRLGVGSFSDVLAAQSAVATTLLQVADSRAAWQRARWRLATALGRLGPLALQ